VTFAPPSSIPSGSVTVVGTVAVSGPMTDAEFAAHLPLAVTGPLTNAQLLAAEPLAVTASLDTTGLATEETLSDIALTAILQRDKLATK